MGSRTGKYGIRALDFIERVKRCTSSTQVGDALIDELKFFGLDYVTVWTVPPPGSPLSGILLNTRPESYVQRYVEENYVLRDPVALHLRRCPHTFSWGDVRASRQLSRAETDIMDEAREFDVRDGLTVPIVTATGSFSVVSPCGRAPELTPDARGAVTLISMYGHQSLKQADIKRHIEDRSYEPLSAREREVLQFVAWGKSDIDIAAILGLSHKTASAHVENARKKLGAPNRVAAVYIAVHLGELS